MQQVTVPTEGTEQDKLVSILRQIFPGCRIHVYNQVDGYTSTYYHIFMWYEIGAITYSQRDRPDHSRMGHPDIQLWPRDPTYYQGQIDLAITRGNLRQNRINFPTVIDCLLAEKRTLAKNFQFYLRASDCD